MRLLCTDEHRKASQDVFDAALKHIRNQRCQSGHLYYDAETDREILSCDYKNQNGLMCAFAPTIKHYRMELESLPADRLLYEYETCLHDWAKKCDYRVAVKIQQCHDCWSEDEGTSFMEYFESNMEKTARLCGLNYTPEA